MRVESIQLQHYRNYDNIQLQFSPNINIFIGNNAQGKTNLLESLYVLSMTRSHRTHVEKELIEDGHSLATITGNIQRQTGRLALEVLISKQGRKTKINHLDQSRLSAYVGQLNVILFSPEDLALIKGSPATRRKFIDMDLGQINPTYLYQLSQYQHILKQRNHYLKQSQKRDEIYLDVLDQQLAEAGAQVILKRAIFIERLEKLAQKMHQSVSNHQEHLQVGYLPNVSCETLTEIEVIQTQFLQKLKEARDRDLQQKTTSVGPHRDDIQFIINDRNVQKFGSQGQQRLAVLSMKLAEIDLMKEETGEYPILLLDDVMSELDNERQMQLMKVIEGRVQTFITTTTLEHLKDSMLVQPTIFEVSQGQIMKEEGVENRD